MANMTANATSQGANSSKVASSRSMFTEGAACEPQREISYHYDTGGGCASASKCPSPSQRISSAVTTNQPFRVPGGSLANSVAVNASDCSNMEKSVRPTCLEPVTE